MAVPNLTANSPVTGSISWSAFSIQYAGVGWGVPADSTSLRYTFWLYNGGSPILSASDDLPNLGPDDLLLFINKAGVPINVPSSSVLLGDLIVDGTVAGSAVIAGTLHGDRVQANTLTANQIAANAIGVDELAANAVVADKVAALAIDVSKLAVGDLTNLAADGMLEDPEMKSWTGFESRIAASGTDPAYLVAAAGTNANFHTYNTNQFGVTPLEKFQITVDLRTPATNTANATTTLCLRTRNAVGGGVSYAQAAGIVLAPDTAWTTYTREVTIPAGASVSAVFDPFFNGVGAGQKVHMRRAVVRRMDAGQLIVDGGILASKLAASSIDVSKLTVAGFDNLLSDPEFRLSTGGWTGLSSILANGNQAGNRPVGVLNPNGATVSVVAQVPWSIPTENAAGYRLRVKAYSNLALPAGVISLRMRSTATDGTTVDSIVGTSAAISAGGWVEIAGTAVVPTAKTYVTVGYYLSVSAHSTQTIRIAEPSMVRAATGNLVVDGSIATVSLAANAVTTDKLSADAITAKHTITGATIQTIGTAARGIKLLGSALVAYTGSGGEGVILNGADGTLTVNGTSSSITGATYRTRATGERVEINTDTKASTIKFFSGAPAEVVPPYIYADNYGDSVLNGQHIFIASGQSSAGSGNQSHLALGRNTVTGHMDAEVSGNYVRIIADAPSSTTESRIDARPESISLISNGATGVLADVLDSAEFAVWTRPSGGSGTKRFSVQSDGVEIVGPLTVTGSNEVGTFSAIANWTNSCTLQRSGKVVTVTINLNPTANASSNAQAALLPSGWRPAGRLDFWGTDVNTGNQIAMYIDTAGGIRHIQARNTNNGSLGYATFVAV